MSLPPVTVLPEQQTDGRSQGSRGCNSQSCWHVPGEGLLRGPEGCGHKKEDRAGREEAGRAPQSAWGQLFPRALRLWVLGPSAVAVEREHTPSASASLVARAGSDLTTRRSSGKGGRAVGCSAGTAPSASWFHLWKGASHRRQEVINAGNQVHLFG